MGNIEELATSIATVGLINPITLDRQFNLIAGERRLRAHQQLGLVEIAAQFLDQLTPDQVVLIELEENIKRHDFDWKEETFATTAYHNKLKEMNPEGWSIERTSERSGLYPAYIKRCIKVAKELQADNQRVHAAAGINAAYNIIARATERKVASELSKIDLGRVLDNEPDPESEPEVTQTGPAPAWRPVEQDLLVKDFLASIETYHGPKYNFIHCDFPYGVGMHKSAQAQAQAKGAYRDTPDIYFALLEAFLANRNRFITDSAHIMFWFSMDYYQETLNAFNQFDDFFVDPFPLIWTKSDGRGILPDADRRARRTYETALHITRGGRKIVSPVANSYSAPTNRSDAIHISQKPEPVLKHFFRLFVDEVSEVFDPTCGSGTALAAAEALGAKKVMGWDLSEEYIFGARDILRRQRQLTVAHTVLL